MRITTATAALGVLLLASACGGSSDSKTSASDGGDAGAATKPGATVPMVFTEFKPAMFTIKAGESLTFDNVNPIGHTIVGGTFEVDQATGLRTSEKDDGTFKLDVSKKGDKVTHTYSKPGTYTFFCTIHKGMQGTVTVT